MAEDGRRHYCRNPQGLARETLLSWVHFLPNRAASRWVVSSLTAVGSNLAVNPDAVNLESLRAGLPILRSAREIPASSRGTVV
jgi:hypothetical protein